MQQDKMIDARGTSQPLGNFEFGKEILRFGGELHVRFVNDNLITFHRDLVSINRNLLGHFIDSFVHLNEVPINNVGGR